MLLSSSGKLFATAKAEQLKAQLLRDAVSWSRFPCVDDHVRCAAVVVLVILHVRAEKVV